MPTESEPEPDDRVFRFTIRTLYVIALALNAVVIWDAVRDTPEGKAVRAKWAKLNEAARNRYRQAQEERKAESWVVFEAIEILREEDQTHD